MRTAAALARFTGQVFTPHVYVTYAILWVLSLEAAAAATAHTPWHPGAGTAVRCVSAVLVLFYLRVVDEQKDLDYDREHNPDRPLVRGTVTVAQLRGAMAGVAVLLIALNAPLSPLSLLPLAVDLGYAWLLVVLERRSARVRDGLLLNLAVTHPVQLLLSAYVYLSLIDSTPVPARWTALPLLLVFACVFLHFEFARKTRWYNEPGSRMYSGVIGPVPSALVALGWAVLAAVLATALLRDPRALLPCVLLAFPGTAALRFLRGRAPAWPVPAAMVFVVGFLLALLTSALLIQAAEPGGI
ncbi:hypothetical protein AB0D12_35750 [Streptomyces sp. NPDC048479]|uniref:hypothetical protein n=1 Tax=Streptomyces sp. NPDC048479 TaxID=3154725 RepID=UPI003440F411